MAKLSTEELLDAFKELTLLELSEFVKAFEAAAHGTSTAKLNALNGLNLNSSTVLAKGSELYVPAQP
jgi:ribosomal protein L7/L12